MTVIESVTKSYKKGLVFETFSTLVFFFFFYFFFCIFFFFFYSYIYVVLILYLINKNNFINKRNFSVMVKKIFLNLEKKINLNI